MARVKLFPPVLPVLPDASDEYARQPRYADGEYEATTGPRDLARFLGNPSRVITPEKQ